MHKHVPLPVDVESASGRVLRQCALFSSLEADEFDVILQHSNAVELSDDELLFQQDQPADRLFVLETGQIKLARLAPDGHEKVIDLIAPGQTFAEAIMFAGINTYPVTATALIQSRVLCIQSAAFKDILEHSTTACFAVMSSISVRLHRQVAEIDRLSLHNAMFRVIFYMLDRVPSRDRDMSEISLGAPKHIIASRLSITPETLSRTLARLKHDGLIDIREQTILLKDIGQLRAAINDTPI